MLDGAQYIKFHSPALGDTDQEYAYLKSKQKLLLKGAKKTKLPSQLDSQNDVDTDLATEDSSAVEEDVGYDQEDKEGEDSLNRKKSRSLRELCCPFLACNIMVLLIHPQICTYIMAKKSQTVTNRTIYWLIFHESSQQQILRLYPALP